MGKTKKPPMLLEIMVHYILSTSLAAIWHVHKQCDMCE